MCTTGIWASAQHQLAGGKDLYDVEQQDAVPRAMHGNKERFCSGCPQCIEKSESIAAGHTAAGKLLWLGGTGSAPAAAWHCQRLAKCSHVQTQLSCQHSPTSH